MLCPCFKFKKKKDSAFVLKEEESFTMANKTTTQGLYIQENPDASESCENIPPGGTVQARISKLKRPHEENKPLSNSYTFSTPAPKSKQMSRVSFKSALTPIIKQLNIDSKSPEPSTHENTDCLTAPPFSFGPTTADYHKSAKSSVQKSNLVFSSSFSAQLFSGMDVPVSFLVDECLPEITLLDSMCDSTIQLTRNDAPVPDRANTPSTSCPESISEVHPPEFLAHVTTMDVADLNAKTVDPSQSKHAPVPWLVLEKFLPEITLLDVTHDSQSSPGEQEATLDVTQDLPPSDLKIGTPLSELSEKIVAEPSSLGTISGEKLSSASVQSDRCMRENITKTSLDVTQDITMRSVLENSKSSSEPGEHNMGKSQMSAEDTLGNNSANITREIIMSSDMSAHAIECSTSPTQVTSELCEKPVVSSDMVESNNEELVTSHETKSTSKPSGQNMEKSQTSAADTLGRQPTNITCDITTSSDASAQGVQLSTANVECDNSPKKVTSEPCRELVESSDKVKVNNEDTKSGNGAFDVGQTINLNATSDVKATASVSYPENKTLDLHPLNVNCSKDETVAPDQPSQNCSSVKECGPCHVQNATFEKHSLQKSSDGTVLGKAAADLKNNTFDSEPSSKKSDTITLSETASSESSQNASKPNSTVTLTEISSSDGHQSASKPNGTITLSETSSSDSPPRSSGKPATPKVSNLTTSLRGNNSEVDPDLSKHNVTADSTDHNAKVVDTHDDASGATSCQVKDHSGVPVMGDLSDSLSRQSIGTVNNKADTFNLDDTLDLKADCLITSTPMTNCKIFNLATERGAGIIPESQKKLYTDGPSKPADQLPSDVPSNLVCDRKTFFKQPPAKSLCPPSSKAAAPLMKLKSLCSIPARLDTATSGLSVKRQRTQAEASRNTAFDAPHGVGL